MTIFLNDKKLSASMKNFILDAYQGRTILITGGRGYIGSALTQSLSETNCKLILLDQSPENAWIPEYRNAKVLVFKGDVSKKETWNSVLSGVDYVFHLASREYFYRSECYPERDLNCNALPTLHLLEACRKKNYRPKIVFASSANLFGLSNMLPVNEDNFDDPLTIWSVHKLTAEHYLRLYSQQFGINSISLRLANVYGPTARMSVMTRVVINKVIAKAIGGETLITYANRKCVRDYVFLKDVIQSFLIAGANHLSNKKHFYVIGSGEGETIANVWQLIANRVMVHTGKNIPIRFEESVKIEPIELRNFVADTDLFKRATGWKPLTPLSKGIDITVRTFLSESGRFL